MDSVGCTGLDGGGGIAEMHYFLLPGLTTCHPLVDLCPTSSLFPSKPVILWGVELCTYRVCNNACIQKIANRGT